MTLRLSIFNTSSKLPLFAAEQAGCLAHHGASVQCSQTPKSDTQHEGRWFLEHALINSAASSLYEIGGTT